MSVIELNCWMVMVESFKRRIIKSSNGTAIEKSVNG